MFEPVYLKDFNREQMKNKIASAYHQLQKCKLCPRECSVNRLNGETGICNTGKKAMISNYAPHFGEEPPLLVILVQEPCFLLIAVCIVVFVRILTSATAGLDGNFLLRNLPKS